MNPSESHFERPIASVDDGLVMALTQVEAIAERSVRQVIGDASFEEIETLEALNRSLEESLSDETRALLEADTQIRHIEHDLTASKAIQSAHSMIHDDDVFDEDSGRRIADVAMSQTDKERFIEHAQVDTRNTAYHEAQAEIREELTNEVEDLLIDTYPELEVRTISDGRITFHTKGTRTDPVYGKGVQLNISFVVENHDIVTQVGYTRELAPGDPSSSIEMLDVASLGGEIDHISLDALKRDALRALEITLRGRL